MEDDKASIADACTLCGACADTCPVQARTLSLNLFRME
ncbi:4Fe-4S binding protein [Sporomusa termitida]